MNKITIDLESTLGNIDHSIFGGFAEHLGRCIYGGIFDEGSPLADERGFRTDVLDSLRRLRMPVIRYPGGNFASGYRWMDGVGPRDERPTRLDLAWKGVESNRFGTNEFVEFCRLLGTEPYMVVNCGDGDLREARDWVEYCNGNRDTTLVKLRRSHGYEAPHRVKYWGIGNEVDGHWQIGYKTPYEYARAYTEFAKVMKWVDPSIRLLASAVSDWNAPHEERAGLLLEHAAEYIDYLALHWYVGNPNDDFSAYMAESELMEERLTTYEGILAAANSKKPFPRPVSLAIDEWNVWYRTHPRNGGVPSENGLEERYNLEDALAVAMHLNAFIRHCRSVKMANIAQIVNVIAPVFTSREGLFLQTIFYPFELYSSTCGPIALNVRWEGETFAGGGYNGIRVLDVAATLDATDQKLVVYAVNRSRTDVHETEIGLTAGSFAGPVSCSVVNGPDIKSENSFDEADLVRTTETQLYAVGSSFTLNLEPHSVTALVAAVR